MAIDYLPFHKHGYQLIPTAIGAVVGASAVPHRWVISYKMTNHPYDLRRPSLDACSA